MYPEVLNTMGPSRSGAERMTFSGSIWGNRDAFTENVYIEDWKSNLFAAAFIFSCSKPAAEEDSVLVAQCPS